MTDFAPKFISEIPPQAMRWRRVVTGERDGRSSIVIDEAECPFQMGVEGANGVAATDLWRTGKNPQTDPAGDDSCSLPLVFGPDEGGTVIQVLEWPTDQQLLGTNDPAVAKAATFHQTATIDYITILSGEIWIMMEDGETLLRKGDTLIQRGTRHGWSNRGNEPCVMLSVMISARP